MDLFPRLVKSKFRSKFRLKEKDIAYIQKRGINKIREDAYFFISTRIAPKSPKNDGRQTPMKNHPVFIAQHATATCCRGCLEKWHKIPKNTPLSQQEIDYIIDIIIKWIEK